MSISVGDATSIVAAGVSVASVLGGAIAWLWARVEKANREIRAELKKCEERETRGKARRSCLTTIIELFWQEVSRLAPESPVLKRAEKLLDDMKIADAAAAASDAAKEHRQ